MVRLLFMLTEICINQSPSLNTIYKYNTNKKAIKKLIICKCHNNNNYLINDIPCNLITKNILGTKP